MSKPADSFLKHLRDWFTVFLPRQRAASPNTIESARRAWNMLLRHVCDTRRIPVDKITFPMLDRSSNRHAPNATGRRRHTTSASPASDPSSSTPPPPSQHWPSTLPISQASR